VHNGSSLFTGDAGQGESNIRRWIIENDWLEAIIALPLNMFYNTGIATYIWLLTNRKPAHRQGKVQLIDATAWYKPLRKNLGKKNCELSEEDIQRIVDTFLAFQENEQSKIFPNKAFGYWKITVERPLRLRVDLSDAARMQFHRVCKAVGKEPLTNLVERVAKTLERLLFPTTNSTGSRVDRYAVHDGLGEVPVVPVSARADLAVILFDYGEDCVGLVTRRVYCARILSNPLLDDHGPSLVALFAIVAERLARHPDLGRFLCVRFGHRATHAKPVSCRDRVLHSLDGCCEDGKGVYMDRQSSVLGRPITTRRV
jgi:hypothetical protein